MEKKIVLRMSPYEADQIKQAADKERRSVNNWCVKTLVEKATE